MLGHSHSGSGCEPVVSLFRRGERNKENPGTAVLADLGKAPDGEIKEKSERESQRGSQGLVPGMLTTKAPPGAFPRLVHKQTGQAHSIPRCRGTFALQSLWAAYIQLKFGAGDGGEGRGSLPSPAFAALLRCRGCAGAGSWQSAALAADWLPPPCFPQRQGNLLRISGWKIHPSRRQQERGCCSSPSPSLPSPAAAGGSLPPLSPQRACKLRCQPQTRSCFLWFFAANS